MAEQQNKRPKFSKDTESSGGKKSSSVPATTVTPSPAAATARIPKLAAASPVAMTKPAVKSTATSPSAPGLVAPSPKALEDGGALEKAGWAVVGVPAEEKAIDGLTAKNKKWLHCAACPGALKPPISMCGVGHAVCCDCAGANKHCGECGRAATYTHVPCMDGLVGTLELPCPYSKFGCGTCIPYHAVAEHKAMCAHAPCYCLYCTPPFEGSPTDLLRHLTEESGRHRWPAPQRIKYGTEQSFVLPASSTSDQRRLLVREDDGRVFLLALGASGGRRPVTVVCVRDNARPVYKVTLTVEGPPDEDGDDATLKVTARVPTCPVPGEVDMEGGRLNAHVSRKMLHGHGESMKVHLSINFP